MIGRRDYAERKAARIERLNAKASRLANEAESKAQAAKQIADMRPFGQPILIGHHSQRRAERDQEKVQNGFRAAYELVEQSKATARRAEAAENNTAINSDDPTALEQLKSKLEGLEAQQKRLAEIRKAFKKGERALLAIGVDQITADEMMRYGGVPSYAGSNLSGRISATKKRIAELEKAAARPQRQAEQIGSVLLDECENRVRLHFNGKPPEAIRDELKSNGFRWVPSDGVWQRKASDWAWRLGQQIAAKS